MAAPRIAPEGWFVWSRRGGHGISVGMSSIADHFRRVFIAGAFAAVPLVVTGVAVWYVESSTQFISTRLFGRPVPLVGLVICVGGVYLLGLAISNALGKWVLGRLDQLLSSMPVLKPIYQAWKQVTLNPEGSEGVWSRVVLVRLESDHAPTLGFTSGHPVPGDPNTICVYVPSAPAPTTGRIYFVSHCQCTLLPLSPEEAFKIILSGGNYVPPEIGAATSAKAGASSPATADATIASPPAATPPPPAVLRS